MMATVPLSEDYKYLIIARHYDAAYAVARFLQIRRPLWKFIAEGRDLRGRRPPYSRLIVEASWTTEVHGERYEDLREAIWTWRTYYPNTIQELDLDAELKKAAKYA